MIERVAGRRVFIVVALAAIAACVCAGPIEVYVDFRMAERQRCFSVAKDDALVARDRRILSDKIGGKIWVYVFWRKLESTLTIIGFVPALKSVTPLCAHLQSRACVPTCPVCVVSS